MSKLKYQSTLSELPSSEVTSISIFNFSVYKIEAAPLGVDGTGIKSTYATSAVVKFIVAVSG